MKLILLKTNLKEGLDAVSHATGENTHLPILKNILLKASSNRIELAGTNLELAISKYISGKTIEEGGIAIPSGTLSSLISNLPDERINLETNSNTLVIKSDNYEARLQGMSPEEFPLIPQIKDKERYLKISGGILKEALVQVVNATQYSEWRQELNGVLFDFEESRLVFVATDSFRLSKKIIAGSQFESNWPALKVIVPIKTIQELIRIIKDTEIISIYFDESQIMFISEETEVISRLIEGKFPDYEAIIPKTFETEAIIEKGNLMHALKLAGIFSGKVNDVHLKIEEGHKMIEIYSSNTQLGDNKYLLAVKSNKGMPEIIFNCRYFVDGLKAISEKDIYMGINGEDKPVIIRSVNDQSLVYLLMPIRM